MLYYTANKTKNLPFIIPIRILPHIQVELFCDLHIYWCDAHRSVSLDPFKCVLFTLYHPISSKHAIRSHFNTGYTIFRADTFTFVLYTNSSVSDNKITNFCIPPVTHAWHGMFAVLLLFFLCVSFIFFGVLYHLMYFVYILTVFTAPKRHTEKDSSHQHANIDFK